MELSGGWLKSPACITFEQKYGVWFFTGWDRALAGVSEWGYTEYAIKRYVRNNHLNFKWL